MKNCKNVGHYVFGRGAMAELPEILSMARQRSAGGGAIFIVDEFFKGKCIEPSLGVVQDMDAIVFARTSEEPHADYINEIVAGLRTQFDGRVPSVVGMGGGSAMDIAKCVSILLTNPGAAEDYQGWDLVRNTAAFKIGIPTLSGTGAEATRTAVLTSRVKKLGVNSDESVFDQVILDPDLLATVPSDQFMYTAMDCYIHCVESLRGRTNDAMTIAFAEKALALLREIFLGEMDHEKLMVASYLGGCAVANSNVGICHPLSYGLSLVLGVHHGLSVCVAFNQLAEYYPEVDEFRRIFRKHGVELPRGLTANAESEMGRMVEAVRKNEKPLENAFGSEWRTVFSGEKVRAILERI